MQDTLLNTYNGLRPAEFHDVDRIEICQSDEEDGWELTVQIELRHVRDQRRKLLLSFSGVKNLCLKPPEGSILQISLLEVRSIRERQWERVNYTVSETENEAISFLCHDFSARIEQVG